MFDLGQAGFFFLTFVLALGVSLYLTPLLRAGALHFGVLDRPDGALKTQHAAVPLLGGVAVYVSFLVTLSFVFELRGELLGVLLGTTLLAMLGLFDDLRILPVGLKLAGQVIAAWVSFRAGIYIEWIALPPLLAIGLSFFWTVGVTNAVNLIDVADGVAAGVCAIATLGFCVLATLSGDHVLAVVTLALCGSIVGFLWYNRPPARIYLGDCGSLALGYMLAALGMIGSYGRDDSLGPLAPLLVLWVPLSETAFLTIARLRQGIAPWQGSRDHLAHRLAARGFSPGQTALGLYFMGVLGSVGAVAVTVSEHGTAITILATFGVVTVLVLGWLLAADTQK